MTLEIPFVGGAGLLIVLPVLAGVAVWTVLRWAYNLLFGGS